MPMLFDNLPMSPKLAIVLDIIRKGIGKERENLRIKDSEDIKNQKLTEAFNVIGTQNEKFWIGACKEHKSSSQAREDIYFYLNDDNHSRIFYIEVKRLPKAKTVSKEEYVLGISTSGKPSGGIERYKLGIHGEPKRLKYNGIIAYVENKTVPEWVTKINKNIKCHFPDDTCLQANMLFENEYISTHLYSCDMDGHFKMYHFWIELSK